MELAVKALTYVLKANSPSRVLTAATPVGGNGPQSGLSEISSMPAGHPVASEHGIPPRAPWRIEYILAPKPPLSDASLFTRIAQSSDDVATTSSLVTALLRLLNTYPYTGGHLMTVPLQAEPDFNGLTDSELLDLMRSDAALPERADERNEAGRIQHRRDLGKVAGAGSSSIWHITSCPRWNGDTNFMRSITTPQSCPRP